MYKKAAVISCAIQMILMSMIRFGVFCVFLSDVSIDVEVRSVHVIVTVINVLWEIKVIIKVTDVNNATVLNVILGNKSLVT